eukprot:1160018-Pelagomonas_calceolata.AAC.10
MSCITTTYARKTAEEKGSGAISAWQASPLDPWHIVKSASSSFWQQQLSFKSPQKVNEESEG